MRKVLMIEDDATLRFLLSDWLNGRGFQPIVADSGFMGVNLAKEHQPDLILCNVQVPQIDGYEVLKVLRNCPQTAHTPFFFVASEFGFEQYFDVLQLGADGFIKKPSGISDLRYLLTVMENGLGKELEP
jgi:DNA-binding response OmpR family regulator